MRWPYNIHSIVIKSADQDLFVSFATYFDLCQTFRRSKLPSSSGLQLEYVCSVFRVEAETVILS
jgi:hypothetical protein